MFYIIYRTRGMDMTLGEKITRFRDRLGVKSETLSQYLKITQKSLQILRTESLTQVLKWLQGYPICLELIY